MPLVQCRACKHEVSSDAPSCPQCGAPDPSGAKAAAAAAATAKSRLGCVWVVIGVFVLLVVGEIVESWSPPPTSTGDRTVNLDTLRTVDSTRALAFLAGGVHTVRDSMDTDLRIHLSHLSIPHAALHRRVVDLLLDSMRATLAGDSDRGDASLARAAYDRELYDPLTPGQETRRATLRRRAADRDAQHTVEERRAFAATYETKMLEQYQDVHASAVGPYATTFRIEYILMSRPLAYNLLKNAQIIAGLKARGFRRIILTDGDDETYSWDIP